jgi:hypothetical protein
MSLTALFRFKWRIRASTDGADWMPAEAHKEIGIGKEKADGPVLRRRF